MAISSAGLVSAVLFFQARTTWRVGITDSGILMHRTALPKSWATRLADYRYFLFALA